MRRYPKSRRTAKQRVERAQAQMREIEVYASTPTAPSQASVRGIGIVTPKARVRASKPKWTPRIECYIAANGARIPIEPMPYLELARYGGTRTRKTTNSRTKASTEHKRDLRSIASANAEARYTD